MKDGDDTQENVGEEEDTQELASDTVAEAPAGNDASNTTAHTAVSTTVIDTHLIEDFEVPITQYFTVLYKVIDNGRRSTPIPPTRIRQLEICAISEWSFQTSSLIF
jgi:hypothetical protein